MGRLTKLGVQRALLNGKPITWADAAGKGATLRLAKPEERRLFAFLLNSTVREPKGLPENFIEGLLVAFHGADDPAERVLSAIDQAGIGGRVMGLVDVVGDSAQPIALNGQFLLVGTAISAQEALEQYEGRPVIASDTNDNRYFKRLRQLSASAVVLESLEINGDFPPVPLSVGSGLTDELMQVWPVLGVLFERPH